MTVQRPEGSNALRVFGGALFGDFSRVLQLGEDFPGVHFCHDGLIHPQGDETFLLVPLATRFDSASLSGTGQVLVPSC
jgi:hypothetical protein